MDLATLVWDIAVAQSRAMQAQVLPLHDAHVQAYDDALVCQHCGELFAPAQMLHGECLPCWHEGLEQAKFEERGYAELVRRMS